MSSVRAASKFYLPLAFASGFGTAMIFRRALGWLSKGGKLRLHLYDHCPFCVRVELVLGRFKIPYERVVYGYGDKKGPVALTGKKVLPVLEGPSVPTGKGMKGMPESLDIIAYLTSTYDLSLPCDTGRRDVRQWKEKFDKVRRPLQRPRLLQMPVKDWATPEDKKYARQKYSKDDPEYYEKALKATPELLSEASQLLKDLQELMQGENSLNAWGFGMDDVKILPDLRNMTCVQGIEWPEKIWEYVSKNCEAAGVTLYEGVP
mmetsp:Transcript_17544/g.28053  ORF Transcript_17544/g.28053 Transcript_17544/m.28053 type:complete len:261 (+) Transcript_17544:91-873(+)|eukprot:jgi/Bigna1/85503/estExt_fgenesh1_pg.C_40237